MIHVYYVVTHLQLVDLFEGDDGFASACVLRTEAHAVVTLEYLVIGVAAYFRTAVNKSLVQRMVNGHKLNTWFFVIKDGFEAVCLLDLVR